MIGPTGNDAHRIADPVHGAIGLSELEWRVVNTPAFQRLRRVKHLGFVSLVYPSADFSRFAHSLGTCHVVGRVLDAPGVRRATRLRSRDVELHRLAGLLHDVGHYPLSHTLENAALDYYGSEVTTGALAHEELGKRVILDDKRVSAILGKPRARDVVALLNGETRMGRVWVRKLIGSDLDADRIDYLLRTAHFAGLPYGHVDIAYLMQHFSLTDEGDLYLGRKALRAADHLLLCRFFDRQQVAFNEQVVAFELLLKDLVTSLLAEGGLDLSAAAMRVRIATETWREFDDETVMEGIRELARHEDGLVGVKARALLARHRPVCVADVEFFGHRSDDPKRFPRHRKALLDEVPKWAEQSGTPEGCWYVWGPREWSITTGGLSQRLGQEDPGSDEDADTLVHLEDPDTRKVVPLVKVERSLMHVLCERLLCHFRVYVLLAEPSTLSARTGSGAW